MSIFSKLRAEFCTNWSTVLVGWDGLGVFSPWPDRSNEFPPLLSVDEIGTYAREKLEHSSANIQKDLIVKLLVDLDTNTREGIRVLLLPLAELRQRDQKRELRKWRVILLRDLLTRLPDDPLYGLLALTEFWQSFGFPADGPHEVQGRGGESDPAKYFRTDTLQRLLERHRVWIAEESAALKEGHCGR